MVTSFWISVCGASLRSLARCSMAGDRPRVRVRPQGHSRADSAEDLHGGKKSGKAGDVATQRGVESR